MPTCRSVPPGRVDVEVPGAGGHGAADRRCQHLLPRHLRRGEHLLGLLQQAAGDASPAALLGVLPDRGRRVDPHQFAFHVARRPGPLRCRSRRSRRVRVRRPRRNRNRNRRRASRSVSRPPRFGGVAGRSWSKYHSAVRPSGRPSFAGTIPFWPRVRHPACTRSRFNMASAAMFHAVRSWSSDASGIGLAGVVPEQVPALVQQSLGVLHRRPPSNRVEIDVQPVPGVHRERPQCRSVEHPQRKQDRREVRHPLQGLCPPQRQVRLLHRCCWPGGCLVGVGASMPSMCSATQQISSCCR